MSSVLLLASEVIVPECLSKPIRTGEASGIQAGSTLLDEREGIVTEPVDRRVSIPRRSSEPRTDSACQTHSTWPRPWSTGPPTSSRTTDVWDASKKSAGYGSSGSRTTLHGASCSLRPAAAFIAGPLVGEAMQPVSSAAADGEDAGGRLDEAWNRPLSRPETPTAVAPGRPGSSIFPTSPLGVQEQGIPSGRDVEWEPLVDYRRNGVSETTIHGAVAWAHGGELVHSFGGNVLCYGRSMMKPLMMKVFVDALEPVTDWTQRAIACSSHNGDTEHVAAAQSLLTESERGLMRTPLDVPLIQFGRQVRRPRRWYHTCSGEHAAILRALRELGWERVGYTLPHHPLFTAYLDVLRRTLGHDWDPVRVARDGCGLPTVSNTVSELARLFSALARDRDDDWIWEAMVRHPDLIGGFNRLDSTILKSCDGRVIAKEGADGLLGLSVVHVDYPDGLGITIKIAHGWNSQATWYVARAVLGVLGFDLRNPYPLHRQKAFIVPGVVPPDRLQTLNDIPTWDEWDPDSDRWYYDRRAHQQGTGFGQPRD